MRDLRKELTSAGKYGRRAAVIEAEPANFSIQPYLFRLVVCEDLSEAGVDSAPAILGPLLDKLRPYSGVAWLGTSEQNISEGATERLKRRGIDPPDASIMALNPKTGEKIWTANTSVFGTWLSYSEHYDTLIEGGRRGGSGGRSRLPDEPNNRIAAYRGATGEPIWEVSTGSYQGPLSIRGDLIFLAPSGSGGRGRAINLASGEEKRREQPLTGKDSGWTYQRRYGCNSHNLSEHLITFRSGYAAYFDAV